jgi:hypothetical protein
VRLTEFHCDKTSEPAPNISDQLANERPKHVSRLGQRRACERDRHRPGILLVRLRCFAGEDSVLIFSTALSPVEWARALRASRTRKSDDLRRITTKAA